MAPRKKKEDIIDNGDEEVAHVEKVLDGPKHEQFLLGKLEGIGPTRSGRLAESGVKFLHDLCIHDPQDIARITGLDKEPAEKLCRAAKKQLEEAGEIKPSYMSAREEIDHNKKLTTIHSGCNALDTLFGGGIRGESTSELYGEFGTGKSQFVFTMAVQAIKDKHECIFVDCEKTWDVERVSQIAIARNYFKTEDEAIDAIDKYVKVYRARDATEVMDVMNNLTEILIDRDIKLLLVDGAIGRFRAEYMGREELSVRQMALKPLMNILGKITDYFPTAVIFTNQVLADAGQFFGDPTKPVGGHIVGHAATYRVYLKKAGSKYIARMIDSPHHAKQDVEYTLTEAGVVDAKDGKAIDNFTKQKKIQTPKEETLVEDEPLGSESKTIENSNA